MVNDESLKYKEIGYEVRLKILNLVLPEIRSPFICVYSLIHWKRNIEVDNMVGA